MVFFRKSSTGRKINHKISSPNRNAVTTKTLPVAIKGQVRPSAATAVDRIRWNVSSAAKAVSPAKISGTRT